MASRDCQQSQGGPLQTYKYCSALSLIQSSQIVPIWIIMAAPRWHQSHLERQRVTKEERKIIARRTQTMLYSWEMFLQETQLLLFLPITAPVTKQNQLKIYKNILLPQTFAIVRLNLLTNLCLSCIIPLYYLFPHRWCIIALWHSLVTPMFLCLGWRTYSQITNKIQI